MYNTDALLSALNKYAKWDTLPQELQSSAIAAWQQAKPASSTTQEAAAEQAQENFLRALVSTVPQEWIVTQYNAFKPGSQLQATMHAQAVGTPYGLMCFGGMQCGKLAQLKVKSEVSWIKEDNGYMLQPDLSTVYQATPSQLSSQVVAVAPASDKLSSGWSAQAASPALPVGLLGHSAVLYGSRVFIFGGMETPTPNQRTETDAPAAKPTGRTSNKLRAYAVDEAGTQGGLLPVLSELPQRGEQPSSRMYHRAAVDPGAGVMYVYGGVHVRDRDGARLPADQIAGVLHCYEFHSYTWTILQTSGSCKPCSTTLLAFFWHKGALWAIPDVPISISSSSSRSNSSRSSSKAAIRPQGYQLLRLDLDTHTWEEVQTQGEPPCLRTDSCSLYSNGQLLVYGGKTARSPVSMLADFHVLDLQQQQQPVWKRETARATASSSSSSGRPGSAGSSCNSSSGQQSLLPLAGHAGGVDAQGRVVFYGGYRRYDTKDPQSVLQVLQHGVKHPTPEASQLTGTAAAPMMLALQHVRLQLARIMRQHHPKQVLLRPDGGGGVRLPARLLALYSCLFDDMFQDMLQQEEDDTGSAGPDQPQVVPVPGVSLEGIACVCRWIMGLLGLGSCSMEQLVEMYRIADRLIIERLMAELLEVLAAADISAPQQAAAVLRLTGDLSGRADVASLGQHATTQLRQQVYHANAPGIMALARQHNNQQLQDRCIEVMYSHRKNDVYAVLDFALRFNLPRLQGSCLALLSQVSRGRLVDSAERVVRAASRYAEPGQPLCRLPLMQMLEKDLLLEVALLEAGQVASLPSYAAAAERLGLVRLGQGVAEAGAREAIWQQLRQNKQVLQHLQQRYPQYMPKHAAAAAQGGAPGGQISLLGQL